MRQMINDTNKGTLSCKGFKYRNQRKRYPWWVKSVEKMTTETDDSIVKKPGLPLFAQLQFENHDEFVALCEKGKNRLVDHIKNNVPGWQIQDVSLIFASGTYFAGGYTLDGNYFNGMERISKIVSTQIHPPQKLGVPRWEGSEFEASEMVETAAIHLGAVQVGYAVINPDWHHHWVHFNQDINDVTITGDMKIFIPDRYQYVVILVISVPQAAARRATSPLGGAADRTGFESTVMARERVKNFIKGIGYGAIDLPLPDNPIPYAAMAGLGEMGRMNRLISPLYGGAFRMAAIVTDLPLALDKPIDFGLQEFCKHCKLCAEACPAKALSMDDEPSWEPKDKYGVPGKKVWFEYGERCHTYNVQAMHFCGACLSSCCWTKENTWFHNLMRVIGSKMPFASGMMAYFEKLFGYGVVPANTRDDWWTLKLPARGSDSHNVRRAR
ncbi:MAG: reductive dehalogenase [Thermodesulfobacteriota bacterium]